MAVTRVVPDLVSPSPSTTAAFYTDVLGMQVVMDHGWIVTVADPDNPGCQISFASHDAGAPLVPDVSVEVDDVDAAYSAAVARGAEIVHPVTDEVWGVRRFFVRDPDGHVVNVLGHA